MADYVVHLIRKDDPLRWACGVIGGVARFEQDAAGITCTDCLAILKKERENAGEAVSGDGDQ